MSSSLLSDDKQTHLAHVILSSLQHASEAKIVGDSTQALREIKRVLSEQMQAEEALLQTVRRRLQSYSRPIPEGSQEWDVFVSQDVRRRAAKTKP